MHFVYALVRKSSFSKAQGFVKPAPARTLTQRLLARYIAHGAVTPATLLHRVVKIGVTHTHHVALIVFNVILFVGFGGLNQNK